MTPENDIPNQSHRQLAAIMFTDIVGYTALMGTDEEKTLLLLEKNRNIQKPIVSRFSGKWVKELGDGAIILFDSVLNAVQCALEIQRAVMLEPDLLLKVAIHMGEIQFLEGDVYGDGINVASRLLSLGEGKTVLISAKVNSEIHNIRSITTVQVGTFRFKNVQDSILVYALNQEGLKVPAVDRAYMEGGEEKTTRQESFLDRVKKVIVQHLRDPQLSVENLSALLHISRAQLYRRIVSESQMSPNEFIREIRLKEAQKQLQAGQGNVSEIAEACGFNNLSYFSKVYQERFGVMPSEVIKHRYDGEDGREVELNPFFGREKDLQDIHQILRTHRLVTLTGTGGTGKTRLASQYIYLHGKEFRDGVYFVELAPVSDPEEVLPKMAQILKINQDPSRDTIYSIIEFISNKEILLVLDNLEQIISVNKYISQIVAQCSRLKILSTSRIILDIRGEYEYPVTELETPSNREELTIDEIKNYAAVQLFVERSKAVKHDFELTEQNKMSVVNLIHHLDGLPLAIELAASRIKLFSPEALLKRLTGRIDLLSSTASDISDRHRTLRNAIDWSYSLLSPVEQSLFRSVSIFQGGFTIESANAVAFSQYQNQFDLIDILLGLLNKSLLKKIDQSDGEPRFYMLETIRSYGNERLSKSLEYREIQDLFIQYYETWLDEAEKHLIGPDQLQWLNDIEKELDNIRAVLTELEHRQESDRGLKVVVHVWRFWTTRSMMQEGSQRIKRFLSMESGNRESTTRCRALNAFGIMFAITWRFSDALPVFMESLEIARKINYEPGLAEVLNHLAYTYVIYWDCNLSLQYGQEAEYYNRKTGNLRGTAVALTNRAWLRMFQGKCEEALEIIKKATEIRLGMGELRGTAYSYCFESWIGLHIGEFMYADACIEKAISILEQLNDKQLLAFAHSVKGHSLTYQGKLGEAEICVLSAMPYWKMTNNFIGSVITMNVHIELNLYKGDLFSAMRIKEDLFKEFNYVEDISRTYISFRVKLILIHLQLCEQKYDLALKNSIELVMDIIDRGIEIHLPEVIEYFCYALASTQRGNEGVLFFAFAQRFREITKIKVPPVYEEFHEKIRNDLFAGTDQIEADRQWQRGEMISKEKVLDLFQQFSL